MKLVAAGRALSLLLATGFMRWTASFLATPPACRDGKDAA